MSSLGSIATQWGTALAFALIASGCSSGERGPTPEEEEVTLKFKVTSSAFTEPLRIPVKYTCDGENMSPPLKWSGVRQDAKSIALISDDPDAPVTTWVHWVLYGLPPDVTELAEGVPTTDVLASGARQGINDFKQVGYGGPCPSPGSPHRYFFKVYALDTEVGLDAGATKSDLLRAMKGHILAEGQLMGTYQRKS
jgi:Raf kinase inhibitor-like YbhB/YbcL family protein